MIALSARVLGMGFLNGAIGFGERGNFRFAEE